jgi:hypothetical protein
MANVKTIFLSSQVSEHDSEMTTFVNTRGEIYIEISDPEDLIDTKRWICLDISTAIKLAKQLRTQINGVKGGEYE